MKKVELKKIENYVNGQLAENSDNLKVLLLQNGIVLKVIADWDTQYINWKLYDSNFTTEGESWIYFNETTDELMVRETVEEAMGDILYAYFHFYHLSLNDAYDNGRAMILPNGKVASPYKAFTAGWIEELSELCPQIWWE